MRISYILYVLLIIVSCERSNDPVNGFKYGPIYKGKLKPKVLTDYPKDIDSVVEEKLKIEYHKNLDKKITVFYAVQVEEMEDGTVTAHLDTNQYNVLVNVSTSATVEKWYFFFSKRAKFIGFQRAD